MVKILIIDDDEHIVLSLKLGLETESYEVTTARNGREGLSLIKDTPFDVLVTDLIMPEVEGLETIRKCKEYQPQTKIIAISGGGKISAHEYLALAEALGASRVYPKPVDIQVLRDAIKELLVSEAQ